MLGSIFAFEVRYHLKQFLFYIVTAVFFLFTFGAETTNTVQLGGGLGNVHRNSPLVILQLLGVMSVLSMFIVTAFVASSAQRDFEYGTDGLFFSKPMKKRDYLLGRFAGSWLVSCGVLVGSALGIFVGSLMPWLEPERLGPTHLGPYAFAFAVILLPNLFLIGAVFFALASATRNLLFTYLGVVGFLVVWGVSRGMLSDIENKLLAGLLDPFGVASMNLATRYWTVVERNNALPSLLAGGLLANRLIWIGVGVLALVIAHLAFNPARQRGGRRRGKRGSEIAAAAGLETAPPALAVPAARREFTTAVHVRQFLQQARIEISGVLKGVPFLVILAFGVLNVVAAVSFFNRTYGTPVFPVTHLMLTLLRGSFTFVLLIIVTFYSGELVGKERTIKLNEVYDALPTPTWVTFASKLAALFAVVFTVLSVGAVATILFQLLRGYHHLELGLYAEGLFLDSLYFLLAAVLAVFFQALTNNKFIGYLAMIVFLIANIVMSALDLNHNLYKYAGTPSAPYSDMNGYGHFLTGVFWFTLYWSCFALVLFGLSLLFRVRGTESAWRVRMRQARQRFHGPARALIAVGVLGFVATGSYIFYNTNVLNEYVPSNKQRDRQADYEKKFRRYKDVPQPRITAMSADVDIFPDERRLAIRGHYRLKNKTAQPIATLHVAIDPDVKVRKLDFRAHTQIEKDRSGYSIYRFAQPLQPGEEMTFDFDLAVVNPGFVNDNAETAVVGNGTFFNNRQYFPYFGYQEGFQLVDRNERRKHKLPPVLRMAKLEDQAARANTYISHDSDWIDFETTVSTSADQIAIAPGYLQRTWLQNGRRYFHYKMDAPILNFVSYQSARYAVKRDHWHDVAIEIYYHPPHAYNVGRMIASIKDALDYYTKNFGPYQHRQVRILEFPDYASFAQSFPNTIPFSESIGFIANLTDPDAIDYVYYVTAHEVAHQWWAHQVIGADLQGSTMLSETMAQYSALMVMEHEYGKDKMRRFLKYELDNYLTNRGGELIEELPLMRVENQQYIHYRKGSLVMYDLKDAIGEGTLDEALAGYVKAVKFQQPPYTTSKELVDRFSEATPQPYQRLLDDLFRKITLFENRVTAASYAKRADGRYDVTFTVEAKKVHADGQGNETVVPLDDWIDLGVFGEKKAPGKKAEETVLYFQRWHVTEPRMTIQTTVDALPVKVGIDPYNKLVDRNSDDNRKTPTEVAAKALARPAPAAAPRLGAR